MEAAAQPAMATESGANEAVRLEGVCKRFGSHEVLKGVSLAVPVLGGRMDLGTWQAVYVMEHRDTGHRRSLALHYLGG